MNDNIKTYDIVGRMAKFTGLTQKEIGEQVFNKSKNNFNNQLRRNKIDWKTLIEWAVNKKVDLIWLLTGQGTVPDGCYENDISNAKTSNCVAKQDSKCRNVIEVEHSNLIKQFKNKEQAKAINKDLIHLESMNEEAFREVGSYIKGLIQGLKLATGRGVRPDRRNHDRRQQSDDDKIPDGVDRRSGNDRRRTGT